MSSSSAPSSSSQAAVSSSSAVPGSSQGIAASADSAVAPVAASSSSQSASSSSVASSSSAAVASSSSVSRRDILGPVKVSKVYGIDEMKGHYKSPRRALFMSLIIPGSGQLYVGGSKFNYARGVAYLAIEGALWGGWYYYSVHKYDRQVSRYRNFAKEHYNAVTYETKVYGLYNQLSDETEEGNFGTRYMSDRESYCKSIYGTATANGCYSNDGLFPNEESHLSALKSVNVWNTLSNKGAYYSAISGNAYVLGWDDAQDEVTSADALDLSSSTSETVALGSSENLKHYRKLRSKANDYADMQAWFFGGLILNHLVSAVDAAWSAHVHNAALYEEDVSFLDNIHLNGVFVPTTSFTAVTLSLDF